MTTKKKTTTTRKTASKAPAKKSTKKRTKKRAVKAPECLCYLTDKQAASLKMAEAIVEIIKGGQNNG